MLPPQPPCNSSGSKAAAAAALDAAATGGGGSRLWAPAHAHADSMRDSAALQREALLRGEGRGLPTPEQPRWCGTLVPV